MLFAASLLLFPQEQLTEHVSPERLRATLEELCRSSRLAGSPESKAAADYTAQVFKEAGLDVQRPKYLCHLPRQTKEGLWVTVQGQRSKLDLQERGFLEDHQSQLELVPPMHGLTHPGRVQGPVVFAGRGSEREFQELQDSGVELNGKIALIRYGGLYRGLKVHNAQEAGCVGALLYTDSEDDGEDKGVTMPEGPWRPHDGIQRGSVFNGDGEARTPGWPAHERAPRMALDEIEGLVRIPSLPISMKNARVLFGARSRPEQMGPIEASAEILVEQNSEPVWVENTIGTLKGRDESAEWVVVGAHRDAWGVGAVDNGSGMSVLLEAARILGQAQKDGWQPKRSIVFGAWDAEEWGLVGSTEWVEEHRAVLGARAVAYVNMDVVASGPRFGASCTPGLAPLIRQICDEEQISPPQNLGTPGGGSDHVPFLEVAGVEVVSFGFHGSHGSYHSLYDTPFLVNTHLDPQFRYHAAAARFLVRMLTQLGDGAPVDGVEDWSARLLEEARKLGSLAPSLKEPLEQAASQLSAAAQETQAPFPHRFLRFFIPPNQGRSLIWRTHGYGARWFPEVQTSQGQAQADAVRRVVTAMQRATRILRAGEQNKDD